MDVVATIPDWFVYIVGILFIALSGTFFKLMWARYMELKISVDELQKQMARAATLDDLQVISNRMREDALSLHTRLDDILNRLL